MLLTAPDDLKESLLVHGSLNNASSASSSTEDLCLLHPASALSPKRRHVGEAISSSRDMEVHQGMGQSRKPPNQEPSSTMELELAVSDLDTAAITGNNNNIRVHWLDVSIADSPVAINDTESLILMSSAALDNDISMFKWSNAVRAVRQRGSNFE